MTKAEMKPNRSNRIRRSTAESIFNVFNVIILAVVALLCLYPMLHVLFSSLSDPIPLLSHKGLMLYPKGFNLGGYKMVLQNPKILTGYKNTLIILTGGLGVNMFLTILGAYVFSRKNLKYAKYVMFLIVFTMFFSGGMIPTYLIVRNLGLTNSLWALILVPAMNTTNMIIMRTAFSQIPESLEESARLDGAGDITIMYMIVVPLSTAVIAVITMYYAVYHWNSWFNAMIYLRKDSLYPLQLVLREILISNDISAMDANAGAMGASDTIYLERVLVQYCTIIVATLPILVIYPFLQKYFVKGVMIGSVKG